MTISAKLDRVCIVMMSAAGDVVHVLPLLHMLKAHHPQMHVTWVLQPGPGSLVVGHPLVDEIVYFKRRRGLEALEAFNEIRLALKPRQFDLVINLQVYFKAGIITSFTNAPVKLGFDRARARDGNWLFTTDQIPPHPMQHVQDQYLEFVDALGVPRTPVTWNLGPWEHERAWQREFYARIERPAAAIIVATSKAEKDWMPERWAEVCRVLWHDFGLQPVLCGGESERELRALAVIQRDAGVPTVNALGSGLRRLVAILDGAALAISPDTGPLHMAVAIDRPVVSLIGYSNPKRVGPWRRFHDLMIDVYGEPGEEYPVSMENRSGRMGRVTVGMVVERVERWRGAYAGYLRSPEGMRG
ncbi:MAG: glycosyltransferase family 9 protein [Gemmatimonadetes bacterium]|nr:glycosyltransferase family 9 protein [Gemmatimonadota bacterium]